MDFLLDYAMFLAQVTTLVLGFLACALGLALIAARGRGPEHGRMEVKSLNRTYDAMRRTLEAAMSPRSRAAPWRRLRRRARHKPADVTRRRVFVLDFHGDLRASAVTALREEITAVLTVVREGDEVVVRLESAGGIVHGYGLAASQLRRLRERRVPLTVVVDRIAASGGYMMACVADRIVAAPFAVVGSIGVVSQLPNFNRLLKRHDIDYELFTAGPHKRTVTLFGENTERGRAKLREELDETHRLFREFVAEHRPGVDVERVATGEHWHGCQAVELGLVDELRTSDDYLTGASGEADVFSVRYLYREPLVKRVLTMASRLGRRGDAPLTPLPLLRP